MTASTPVPLDIVPFWGRLNDGIVRLVDYIPDDKLNWSPAPELWNFRGILLHICVARQNWLGGVIKDGEVAPDVLREAQSRDGIKQHLRLSWERIERFVSNPAKLAVTYSGRHPDDEPYSLGGHWVAYHLLEHDIHHRSDIFHYLALLGIEHPDVGTP